MAKQQLDAKQRAFLLELSELVEHEAKVAKEADARAEQIKREMKYESRLATNNKIAEAVFRLGINKVAVANIGLGTPDRGAVYRRIKELPADTITQIEELAEEVTDGRIEVQRGNGTDDGVIVVTLAKFTHPDLGEGEISGTVEFSEDGDVLDTSGDATALVAGDPLWPIRLFGLGVVQEAV